ncbi:MptD family putative ECF transporter S component [Maledivibacter halophilus]|uniref:Energy-coupling factor transport system substrate-specific component n=1 Tax=Maledivibacter halophilus TaxID=36842 RepID=A0A1T5L8W5_9FIRM|nr:MptD family putative ECF transporter S component [Maledivibacter halophilus]SKC72476.1 energy-coupling factor transport system substrate-specific component [Maledivibacter halophilus]
MLSEKRSLNSKDLITTGIFSAIFFIVTMVSGMFVAPNPVTTFLLPVVVAFFTGTVYMLLLAKVPKRGPTIILGVIMGILIFVTGMFWLWSVAYIVLGIIAGEIAAIGKYKSLKMNMMSFVIFSLNPIASYAMVWINKEAYIDYLVSKGTETAYMETMLQTAQDWVLPAMIIGTIFSALLGGFVGKKLLKKHFERAGIV